MNATIKRDADIHLAGLEIWVQRRQFPDSNDYWDGNWIVVNARCSKEGASVHASGPFIHLSELAGFTNELIRLNDELKGEATLPCMEPELSVKLKADKLGHVSVTVTLTPDHLTQQHKFVFDIDQSYLSGVLKQCHAVLEEYPLRGTLTDKIKRALHIKR